MPTINQSTTLRRRNVGEDQVYSQNRVENPTVANSGRNGTVSCVLSSNMARNIFYQGRCLCLLEPKIRDCQNIVAERIALLENEMEALVATGVLFPQTKDSGE